MATRITREAIFGFSADLPRLFEVTLAALRPNPDQPRHTFHADALRELADSIAQRGLIHPIAVAPDPDQPRDRYIIVAGERRVRAFRLLGRETIPALLTTGDPAELTVIENVQRADLHPLDEEHGYRAAPQLMPRTRGDYQPLADAHRPSRARAEGPLRVDAGHPACQQPVSSSLFLCFATAWSTRPWA